MYLMWYIILMLKTEIASLLTEAMETKKLSQQEMAKRMSTSRSQLARLLDPQNDKVQLDTIEKAAAILGMRLKVSFETVSDISPGPQKGRPVDTYTMWLCWELACEVDPRDEFLPQHKQDHGTIGAFKTVGDQLNLSPSTVAQHVRNARSRRETEEGIREYFDWLNAREKQWWFYNAAQIEKRKKLPGTIYEMHEGRAVPKSVEHQDFKHCLTSAQKRRQQGARGDCDFKLWLTKYEQRPVEGRKTPMVWEPKRASDPDTIAMDATRKAKGLRLGLSKAGRPRSKA
jgi:transcriptional regulator with XRE-family HTH domain